jgi:hypothetical protein
MQLLRCGFRCVKLDGRMLPAQRDAVIQAFMTNPTVTVFLVSLKVLYTVPMATMTPQWRHNGGW